MRYLVKCKPGFDALRAVIRFDREAQIELLVAKEEVETYEITTGYDIARILDIEDGVISYEVATELSSPSAP